ncbi:PBSX family phage terminase large subunit [Cuneatibacter caecimuris]|uniref:PBSX family phage terminase large subunit n=1 Tax=Cuneatibacter caecimuris TaxID=1796618 RepID=A0A4Q7PPR0_9FIRM|nr:PBSX family phage terminase large subunit [Cuneatibacter caecimuris]RZT02914.1 PBSX family phage terminase large subunit [Cuneatibacter caecimuris]
MISPKQTTQVRLTDLIAPSFYDLHHDISGHRHTHYKLAGGRGSTKSSFISIEIILGMMQDPNANAIAMRKVGRFLEESVFEQLRWAIDVLGVSDKWKIRLSPLGLTYIPFGNKIIFRGADDPKKIKSVKLSTGYFKYIWFEERAEFDGPEEERTILQSLMRGGSEFFVFYSWNPPKSMNSWVNQDVLDEREDTVVSHTDYRTVPRDWLGEQFFIEAEHLKEIKPKAYEHEYLGVATGTGGAVFENVTVRTISDEEIAMFDRIKQGLDFGYGADPLAYIKMHYNSKQKRLYLFGEIYAVKLGNTKAAREIRKFNPLNKVITADSEEPRAIAALNELGLRIVGAKKGPGSVDYGMEFLSDELEEIIIDPKRCPNATREFMGYELERDKDGNFKGSYPDKNNHTIDAVRYGMEDDMTRRRASIKDKKKYGFG